MFNVEHQLNGLLHHYFKNKEMDELYISVALKSLAVSFVQVFVPIYLYKLGFGISEIALYFLVYFLSIALIQPFCMKLNSILGIKKVLTIGTLSLMIYYLLLNYLGTGNIHYLLVAFSFGVSVAFYYAAFHIEFSQASDKKKEASEFSMIQIMIMIATTLGPLIGAIFISNISFGGLFFIVIGLLIFSVIPLYFSKDRKTDQFKFSFSKVIHADNWKKGISYQIYGILNVSSGVFWPLFIFIILEKIISLGIIISATSLFMIFFIFIIGGFSDKHKKKVLFLGILTHSFSWISRLLFLSPIGIFLNNFYSSLSYLAIDLPFSKFIYEKSKRVNNISNYFLFREFNLEIGRLVILLIAFVTGSIYWTFILSFFATYGYSILLKD